MPLRPSSPGTSQQNEGTQSDTRSGGQAINQRLSQADHTRSVPSV